MTIDFFFVAFRTRRTRPTVSTRRFRKEGWLNAAHVKILFAPITPHRIGAELIDGVNKIRV